MLSDNGCVRGIVIGQEVRGEHVFGDISKKSPLSAFDLQGPGYITLVLPHTKAFVTNSHNFHLEPKRYSYHYGRLQLQVPNRAPPLRR
jgi:hypothetical protein